MTHRNKFIQAGGAILLLFAVASARAEETILLANLRRTVDTKAEDGTTRHTEEPVPTKTSNESEKEDKHKSSWYTGTGAGTVDLSGPTGDSNGFAPGLLSTSRSLSLGYSATHVFHTLTTRFESPNFTHLSWNTNPDVHGQGVEIALHPLDLEMISLGVRGGFFQARETANAQQDGAFYVQESIQTTGGWANLEAQTAPFWGLSLLAGIGGLTYSVDTHIQTNAPAYRYEGLTGSRILMIFGVGGQFEAPWKFAIKPYVQGRFWWTAGAGDPLENGIGQFSTGLTWRF